jgi:lipopolysaccharide export system protein LptA
MTLRHAASLFLLAATMAMASAVPVWARTTDRNKQINIDAGRQQGSTDESAPTVFSGGVHITQGTLDIRSNVAELTVRNGEPTRAVFTGSQVTMKQEMDDGAPVNARADKVDYDLTTETIVFTGNAYLENPRGSTSGPRITYNMKTGRIDSGGDGSGGRVKTTIMPKSAQGKR